MTPKWAKEKRAPVKAQVINDYDQVLNLRVDQPVLDIGQQDADKRLDRQHDAD